MSTAGLTLNLKTGDSVIASNDTIAVAASAAATITGSGDTITGGTSAVITLGANSADAVGRQTGMTVRSRQRGQR